MDRLLLIVEAQKRRFPQGLNPFMMVTRLVEECGELATEVQIWEDSGLKRIKHGDPSRERTAKEVMFVVRDFPHVGLPQLVGAVAYRRLHEIERPFQALGEALDPDRCHGENR